MAAKYASDPLIWYQKDKTGKSYEKVMKMLRSEKYIIRTAKLDSSSNVMAALYLIKNNKGALYTAKRREEYFYYKISLKGDPFIISFGLNPK